MDKQTLKAMADRLQELADGAEPNIQYQGICANIDRDFPDCGICVYSFVAELSTRWPEHSGRRFYPVPIKGGSMWSGEYGAARRRLCGFLAQKIREEIGE